jgi:hypothetical protein
MAWREWVISCCVTAHRMLSASRWVGVTHYNGKLGQGPEKLFCLLRHTAIDGRELFPICCQIRKQE